MPDLPLTLPQLFILAGFFMLFAELFLGIESGLDFILIGSILVISGLLGSALGNIPLMILIAAILAIIYIIIGRKYIKSKITVSTKKTNIDRLIGHTGVVTQAIRPNKPGRVTLDEEHWRARSSQNLNVGDKIVVESIEGVTVNVNPITK